MRNRLEDMKPLHEIQKRLNEKNILEIGQVVMTQGINSEIREKMGMADHVCKCFARHRKGDFGDMCESDRALNKDSFDGKTKERILSAYEHKDFPKIWIITEWDRSVTTILLPEEY